MFITQKTRMNERGVYTMQKEYQAIIVGSGPAGAACAKALKNEGVDVLVIEKDKLPRHKTCSGILFGQTQVLLDQYFGGLPPGDVYCDPKIIKAENIQEWNKERGFFMSGNFPKMANLSLKISTIPGEVNLIIGF